MKGPSEKRDQFAVLEHMKGGQMVTHPCASIPRIEFRHLQVVSMCNCAQAYPKQGGGGLVSVVSIIRRCRCMEPRHLQMFHLWGQLAIGQL